MVPMEGPDSVPRFSDAGRARSRKIFDRYSIAVIQRFLIYVFFLRARRAGCGEEATRVDISQCEGMPIETSTLPKARASGAPLTLRHGVSYDLKIPISNLNILGLLESPNELSQGN